MSVNWFSLMCPAMVLAVRPMPGEVVINEIVANTRDTA